jgi:hypothetical protein
MGKLFADENFIFKWSNRYGTTTCALEILVAIGHALPMTILFILNISMFVTVCCYFNAVEIFLLEPKGQENLGPLLLLILSGYDTRMYSKKMHSSSLEGKVMGSICHCPVLSP